jgi:beta-glucanase (GH16 family)
MKLSSITILVVSFTLLGLVSNTPSRAAPAGYKLVWSDEFNGTVGSLPDAKTWNYDDGPGYNNELEINKVSPTSCATVVDPKATDHHALLITGTPTAAGKYFSARINTKGKYSAQYGYFEARMKIPYGNGMWPAFWLLGNNIDQVGWPKCGEVDIMENIGKQPGTVYGSIHAVNYTGGQGVGTAYTLPNNQALADSYHTYAVDWEPGKIVCYLDSHIYATYTPASLPPMATWAFDTQPCYIILNLAIGGSWPGSPDGSTVFPAKMLVDYVRVYKAPS